MKQVYRTLTLSSLMLVGLPACASRAYYVTPRRAELGESHGPGKRTQIYELALSDHYETLNLIVRTEYQEEVAYLGVKVTELGRDVARDRGMIPYSGLLIDKVLRDSPASNAGILPGEVILAIDGTELIYFDQFEHVLATQLKPGQTARVTVRRAGSEAQTRDLDIELSGRLSDFVTTRSEPLEAITQKKESDFSGLIYADLPVEYTETIFGTSESSALIAGVFIGSPAYEAGIRAGDRVISFAGEPIGNAQELRGYLDEYGVLEQTVEVVVENSQSGLYRTELELEDYHGHTDVSVPFVFGLEEDFVRSDWSLGPLGILMSYDGQYLRTTDRKANFSRDFCLLWGLYGREWTPDSQQTRLLWFITWDS